MMGSMCVFFLNLFWFFFLVHRSNNFGDNRDGLVTTHKDNLNTARCECCL